MKRIVPFFLLLIGLLLCLLFYMIPIGAFSNKLFDTGSIIVVLCVIVFFRYSQRTDLRDNWLKPSNLFLISFLIVNFQFLLD